MRPRKNCLVVVLLSGITNLAQAGFVIPTVPVGGSGGGSAPSRDVHFQSGHGTNWGSGSVSGTGLVTSDMSGSVSINPDNNPDDNVVARFYATINVNGEFVNDPADFPTDSTGPGVSGGSSIYEYSLVQSDNGWDYVQSDSIFSLWFYGWTNYYTGNFGRDGSTELFTNIGGQFGVDGDGAEILHSSTTFNQNIWLGKGPQPGWLTLPDWSATMQISGVITTVPEPATLVMMALGAMMFVRERVQEKLRNAFALNRIG